MEYIKLFENHSDYTVYTADTENFLLPNVSYCVQENEVFMRAHEMTQLTCENMIVVNQGNGTVIFVLSEDTDGGTINVEVDGLPIHAVIDA